MTRIKYSHDDESCNVFQMRAIKGCLQVAYSIAEDSPSELMDADMGIDIAFLRRKFKGFPFFNGQATSEEIGEACKGAIVAALEHRRYEEGS